METRRTVFDVFVISGFVASFFNGLTSPVYVSLILARLDARVIAIGSFLSAGLPVLVGVAMGNRRVFRRLSAALPVVMLAELVFAAAAVALAAVDVAAYYIASMFILGLLSSSVIYLLQKVKESRYRRGRAAFDRRVEMADGLGLLAGSALAVVVVSVMCTPAEVAALGALQTAVVYGLFLLLRRRLPERRRARDDEEPHPCLLTPIRSLSQREPHRWTDGSVASAAWAG
jgi:hypothetical protein